MFTTVQPTNGYKDTTCEKETERWEGKKCVRIAEMYQFGLDNYFADYDVVENHLTGLLMQRIALHSDKWKRNAGWNYLRPDFHLHFNGTRPLIYLQCYWASELSEVKSNENSISTWSIFFHFFLAPSLCWCCLGLSENQWSAWVLLSSPEYQRNHAKIYVWITFFRHQ